MFDTQTRTQVTVTSPVPSPVHNQRSTPIDLLTPEQAGAILQLSADQLLRAVNSNRLPAFELDGAIRFRATDVFSLASAPLLDQAVA